MTRILIADDSKEFRSGIHLLLDRYEDIIVVGEAENGEDAIIMGEILKPDIILMDIKMPKVDGIEATKHLINNKNNNLKIIAITFHKDQDKLIEMIDAGIDGYVLKDRAVEDLYSAIKSVREGLFFVSDTKLN